MSNNSDTISKLSDALSNLINAYETLQKEKEGTKGRQKTKKTTRQAILELAIY